MSRQKRLIYLPLVGATLLCLLAGIYFAAWKRRPKSDSPAKIVKHSVETSSEDALKYWTADKKRSAKPAPMPNVDALNQKKRQPQQPLDTSSSSNAE